jgi:hypothetical protein
MENVEVTENENEVKISTHEYLSNLNKRAIAYHVKRGELEPMAHKIPSLSVNDKKGTLPIFKDGFLLNEYVNTHYTRGHSNGWPCEVAVKRYDGQYDFTTVIAIYDTGLFTTDFLEDEILSYRFEEFTFDHIDDGELIWVGFDYIDMKTEEDKIDFHLIIYDKERFHISDYDHVIPYLIAGDEKTANKMVGWDK